MELKLDVKEFDKIQGVFIKEIVETVKFKLQEAGLDAQQVEDLTAHISFSIASILDDTSQVESDGVEARPYLTFRTDDDTLVHSGENASTYTYVYGIMKKLFNS